jgi:hypothetical protein
MACVLTERDVKSIIQLAQRLESQGLVAESETLRAILSVGSSRREVRAAVAAEILQVTPQTIRNWVKRGIIPGRIDDTGHVFVYGEALRPAIDIHAATPYLPSDAPHLSIDAINAEIEAHRAERRAR